MMYLPAVDQPLLVQAHEHLAHRAREALVQREVGAAPVAARADGLELVEDGGAGLVYVRPHPLHERLAAEVEAGLAFLGERRSTTFWVAMPAWSVPGSQSVSRPRIRSKRMSASWMVLLSPWPMWRLAVTLGGGIMIT